MSSERPGGGSILVVCTGNVCRSPYLERRLAQALSGTDVVVASAGTGALVGHPMDPSSAERLLAAGAAPAGFVARQITREHVDDADLVVTATREHLDAVARVSPRALRYGFALADLSDLVRDVDLDTVRSARGVNRVARAASVALSRRPMVRPRSPQTAGVIDPFRQAPSVFDRMAAEIDELLPPVVRALRG